jgi:hypothetical protein
MRPCNVVVLLSGRQERNTASASERGGARSVGARQEDRLGEGAVRRDRRKKSCRKRMDMLGLVIIEQRTKDSYTVMRMGVNS